MEVKHFDKDVISAEIANGQEIKFENGLAIVDLNIKYKDFYNDICSYTSPAVIYEKEAGKEDEPYELAGYGARYFSAERFVNGIKRIGDNFFLDIITGEENVSWHVYKQFKAKQITKGITTFEFVREIPSKLIPSSHEDIGILKPDLGKMSIYHINEGKMGRSKYSSIEEAQDGLFLVVDTITSTVNKSIKDNLVFLMDSSEYVIGDILSRNNEMEPVEFSLGETYATVVERKLEELNRIAILEKEKIQQLRVTKRGKN